MEYFVELTKALQSMGMKRAFDDQKTDNFSEIGDSLYISHVVQKTYIEVKEEGTEAAAVTATAMEAGSLDLTPKPRPFEMIVDRPFMFLIEDDQTGTILFMGMIFDPQAG